MTERSILSGRTPQVTLRSGGSVVVKGWDSDRILAESSGMGGLQLKRKKDCFEVNIGFDGQVLVPFGSSVRVFAGKSAEVEAIQGLLGVVAGADIQVKECGVLAQATAGRSMSIDCRTVEGQALKLSAGRDLRCWFRGLLDVQYEIDDLGGKWQAVFGGGSTLIQLRAGGDVTLVTDQEMHAPPPDAVIGKIARPG